ncbi:hypothetical protein QJS10_CPA06g00286 [Acorus calamus]|uniref:Uncharacterized protein n=1 Tax=Acorus calamus TaxID=4465 RepID=A0AAV9EN48_ACOCL|nr:hypothetical protein QJS10_CPA06g00286 [Acorus calamus]
MSMELHPKGLPVIVKLNKARQLAEEWVNKMSGSSTDVKNEVRVEPREPRLGLGATPSNDPIEKKLRGQLDRINWGSRKPFKEINISGALGLITEKKLHNKMDPKKAGATKLPKFDAARTDALSGVDDEDDDSESRTSAFAKRHSASPATSMPKKKKHKW